MIAVQDGRVSRLGHSRKLGNFVELQDSYGNTYRYAGLGSLAETYPFPKQRKAKRRELALPEGDPAPKRAASATSRAVARPVGRLAHRQGPQQAGQAAPARLRRHAAAGDFRRRSACSPTPTGRTPGRPAARTSSPSSRPAR